MSTGTHSNPTPPKVAIGLPVRNGQNYLEQAIESVLGQTFSDFTLIISDNASEDGTEEICRRFAAKDPRVVYHRQKENIGAAPNFNFVFKMSRSPYFKWAAHDDVLGPNFLRDCLDLLESDPSLAFAHPMAAQIDQDGKVNATFDADYLPGGLTPSQRLRWLLWVPEFNEFFGLIRSDVLRRTHLLASFGGADRNLVAEILFMGDKGCAPRYEFFRRDFPGAQSRNLAPGRHSAAAEMRWYDPKARLPVTMIWPERLRRYLMAVFAAPITPAQKLACLWVIVERGTRRGIHRLSGRTLLAGRPKIGGPRPSPAGPPRPPALSNLRCAGATAVT
jgi:glycosyltransferase involved in cell wall biosynthesis